MYATFCTMVKPFGYKVGTALSESLTFNPCANFFALCLSFLVGTDRKSVGQTVGQPPVIRIKKKKIKSGGLAPKMGLGFVAIVYALFFYHICISINCCIREKFRASTSSCYL
jgi:hypothetical protein